MQAPRRVPLGSAGSGSPTVPREQHVSLSVGNPLGGKGQARAIILHPTAPSARFAVAARVPFELFKTLSHTSPLEVPESHHSERAEGGMSRYLFPSGQTAAIVPTSVQFM
jgi:hypothetical protein